MHSLNPFLRAFFASRLPSSCTPASQYILLVPTVDFLLTHHDKDTRASYHELSTSEELIACHVVRAASANGPLAKNAKDLGLRDARGKARQYTTLNGRTLVIKDAAVYTNKGFKSLVQAHLLHDALYYNDLPDSPQWLIYYISRPLVGTPEPIPSLAAPIVAYPGQLPRDAIDASSRSSPVDDARKDAAESSEAPHADGSPAEITSFEQILTKFPVIARHMQSGLDNLFKQFRVEIDEISLNAAIETSKGKDPSESASPFSSEAPTLHRRDSSASSSSISSVRSAASKTSNLSRYVSHASALEEQQMRRSLESLVYSAIDVFQSTDKQQLSLLGTSTNLSGPVVERLLERYISESFHSDLLFPRLCGLMSHEDDLLEKNIRQMVDVDITQVGLSADALQAPALRRDLSSRVRRAVEVFKQMNHGTSPHHMIDILLDTQKCLTMPIAAPTDGASDKPWPEKSPAQPPLVASADMLVSLLLLVVIRSPVHCLQARLAYMRDFVFVLDVDLGEIGYALSTYEGVIGYLTHNSDGLRAASRANRSLWAAARKGDIRSLCRILALEPGIDDEDVVEDPAEPAGTALLSRRVAMNGDGQDDNADDSRQNGQDDAPGLAHVFPFHNNQQARQEQPSLLADRPRLQKRVSLEARSMSSSSVRSYLSGSSTLQSTASMAVELAPPNLIQTQDSNGHSALMLAVENRRAAAVQLLLHQQHLCPVERILQETNQDGATLFSVAVQYGDKDTIVCLLESIFGSTPAISHNRLQAYLAAQDVQDRTAAHYIFNSWWIILWLDVRGFSLPWNLKDKNGQTPLFAVCRSYDQDDYVDMVQTAIRAATKAQGSDEILHLDDHMDNKNNTLLHIIKDPLLTRKLLYYCDSDPNVFNERHFTPLMMASKFARLDQVRMLFGDPRTDLQARDHRGLTAVELAKDDEVRNRIDDMLLLSTQSPMDNGRATTIVRSFFVDDGTIRLILKSAAPNGKGTITITTSRRSPAEFENLSRLLLIEHPASWMPSVFGFRSPFQIPSKPSRTVLRDLQLRFDEFLKSLLTHPTFATHEMLWEFFLVPDIDPNLLAERAQMKSAARVDKLYEEYDSASDAIPEVEQFAAHAREQVNTIHRAFKHVIRRVNASRNVMADFVAANRVVETHVHHALPFLTASSMAALERYMGSLHQPEHSALASLHYTLLAAFSTTTALQQALGRPANIITSIYNATEQLNKHTSSASRSARWTTPLGLLEDTRARYEKDNLARARRARHELDLLGRELRYTQTTVANELAGWHVQHTKRLRAGLREFARKNVVQERTRLEGLRRALRSVRGGTGMGGFTRTDVGAMSAQDGPLGE